MARTGVWFCALLAWTVLGGCSQGDPQAMREELARYELLTLPQLASAQEAMPRGDRVRTDAWDANPTWLAMTERMAQFEAGRAETGGTAPTTQPASGPATRANVEALRTADGYIPWRFRRGAAYPGDFWTSLGRYGKEFPQTLWDDTRATATNPFSLVCLGAAGAAGIAIHTSGADKQVASHYTRNGHQLNTFWDSVGDAGGNPASHFAVAGAIFLGSLARQDTDNYEKSSTLLHALALNGLTTVALKLCTNSTSPNGDTYGWPSGHTSSSFTFATVVYEEYGPWVGIPAFAFATYVGYERIDARNHDFSDVISGALIGIAIGHAVTQNHKPRVFGMDIVPYVDPERGAVGVGLAREW